MVDLLRLWLHVRRTGSSKIDNSPSWDRPTVVTPPIGGREPREDLRGLPECRGSLLGQPSDNLGGGQHVVHNLDRLSGPHRRVVEIAFEADERGAGPPVSRQFDFHA